MKDFSKLLTRDFLEEHYIKQNKTTYQIQREFKFKTSTIEYYIKKLGLKRPKKKRPEIRIDITKEMLEQEYYINKLNIAQIVKKYKTCKQVVRKRMAKYGLQQLPERKRDYCRDPGYRDISNYYWNNLKTGAKKRDLEFSITKEYIWLIWEQQQGICAYTGLSLILKTTRKTKTLQTASLDRIDSSKGYVEGNVQWVHRDINCMKWSLSNVDFLQYVKLIAEYKNL